MFKLLKRNLHTATSGTKYSLEYKKYFSDPNNNVIKSFFHDVPINFNKEKGTVSMIVEIPRYEQGKFEISKKLPLNPIVQDIKSDKLRFINNIYPFNGYPCNYGAIPQTWEDPTLPIIINNNKYFGDNDPLDICELSSNLTHIGNLKTVKILGALAMIDDGEMDWKLISIDINDKLSDKLNDIDDIELNLPNVLSDLTTWFKNYKKPMNKPENKFEFNAKWLNKSKALDIIEECNERWKLLINKKLNDQNNIDPKLIKKFPTVFNNTLTETPDFNKLNKVEIIKAANHPNHVPPEAREIFYYKN